MTVDAHPTTTPDPLGAIALLTEQRDTYRQLESLGQQQAELIERDEVEPLLTVLAQRQAVIDRLDALNRRSAPIREQWDAVSDRLSETQRQTVRQLVDEVDDLLERIMRRDDQDRTRLAAARDRIGSSLRQATHAATARRAYGGPANAASPRLTDQQG